MPCWKLCKQKNICTACSNHCKSCVDEENCTECDKGYKLNNGKCEIGECFPFEYNGDTYCIDNYPWGHPNSKRNIGTVLEGGAYCRQIGVSSVYSCHYYCKSAGFAYQCELGAADDRGTTYQKTLRYKLCSSIDNSFVPSSYIAFAAVQQGFGGREFWTSGGDGIGADGTIYNGAYYYAQGIPYTYTMLIDYGTLTGNPPRVERLSFENDLYRHAVRGNYFVYCVKRL